MGSFDWKGYKDAVDVRGVSEYFEGKGTSWMSEMDRTKAVGINADNLIFSDVNPCPKFVGL